MKYKRTLALFLVIITALLLMGCKSSDYKKAVKLFESGYNDGKYYDNNEYIAADMIHDAWEAFTALGDYEDSSERASACIETVLSDKNLMRREMEDQKRMQSYSTYHCMLTYDNIASFAVENGESIICGNGSGGYYDDPANRSECVDEDYWYDPLGKTKTTSGEVGYQHIKIHYKFAGDFAVATDERVFYGTSLGDYGNGASTTLYCKGKKMTFTKDAEAGIRQFLNAAITGSTYLHNGILYAVKESSVLVFISGKVTVFNR